MARYEITAPEGGYNDEVAGVIFTAGRASVSEPAAGALLYFRRHGYTIEALDDPLPAAHQDAPDGPPARPAGRSRSRRKEE
ncbi:hypothetical protein Q3V23_18980 [Streptomyces sp. VNUA116]|uniref:hypothetical protein n=1 Tax=Streptomyces sp. VNUA116 TaxID=3062449 RepID=UPI00267573F0|nr:hypothetical protein [Streptomyces sp. VNUA116]WKU45974.1 hypothetical protein Q3V23_18980 [Streptomyces sp. VNUA116]